MGSAEALGGLEQHRLCHTVWIFIHLAVPESDYGPTLRRKEAGAMLVILATDMLAAVDFNNKLRLSAGKVGCIRLD